MDINKGAPFILVVFCVVFTSGNLAVNKAMKYLAQYKYLNETVAKAALQPGEVPYGIVAEAIKKFQEMASLPVTGELNQETLHKMELPRCGVADVSENGNLNFVAAVRKWPKTLLTWRISKYSTTSKLTEFQQRDAIERALDIWAKQTPLRFQYQTLGLADLNFKFGVRYHGDRDNFDGVGGVLAHATLPTGGEIHFDDEEIWLLGYEAQSKGTELYIVAAHEIGHALGLEHTKVTGALMAPIYAYSSYLQLHRDDISGIQSLYGKRFSRRKSFWSFLKK